ncbi:nucleotidyltransferase family protein [uncultured Roseibium sp.]|uniref:nucleotidyltransferase family protein n=1 Tax=uncultured Roseibium sp. TaxID=1936171 RepID=UPI00261829CF|nr:nucleotidyltransferase family protein [uncultured Roseibium sp.]
MKLSAEETLLLITCKPQLTAAEDALLSRIVATQLNWSFLLWRAETYQTTPLILHHLNRTGLTAKCPGWAQEYMRYWSALNRARTEVQFSFLGELLNHLSQMSIDHYMFKGSLFAALLYPAPNLRPMQDIDIMVRTEDVRQTQKALYSLGYKHGVFNPADGNFTHMFRRITPAMIEHKYALHSVTKIAKVQPTFDTSMIAPEWCLRQIKSYVCNDGSVLMPVFVDTHFNLAAGMDEADVWRGAGSRRVLGQEVLCQSLTTALWFSAARVYYEAFQHGTLKIQMLGDIDALLRVHGNEIDWAELLAAAKKYCFSAAIFYVLQQITALFETPVPETVLAVLLPNQKCEPDPGDFGEILPKLLSRTVVTDLQYCA